MTKSLTLALLLTTLPVTQGAVVYRDIPDAGVFGVSGDAFFDVDVNGDSTVDFMFRSNFAPGDGFVVLPQGSNRVFSTHVMPPDVGTLALDFDHSQVIGPGILGGGAVVLTGQQFDGTGREIGPGLLSCALFSELVCVGQFDTDEALSGGDPTDFVGFVLESNGNVHFGYVEVLSSGFNGGTILSFAYETEPDTPIIAGTVPEPGCVILLGFAAMLGTLRRVRQKPPRSLFIGSGHGNPL